MATRQFEFELYRLSVITEEVNLFAQDARPYHDDQDILRVLQESTKPDLSETTAGRRATYEWALRDFIPYEVGDQKETLVGMTMARSITEREGLVVTDEGIVQGSSQPEPPLAETIQLFIHLRRHLMAVERLSSIIGSRRWLHALEGMIRKASARLGFSSSLEFEPVPKKEEILTAFAGFSRLTRIRVKLRLPNPELSRYAEALYKEMQDGGIQEYLQDMRNSNGLNGERGHLPRASVEMAQAGYKRGTVRLEGFVAADAGIEPGRKGVPQLLWGAGLRGGASMQSEILCAGRVRTYGAKKHKRS